MTKRHLQALARIVVLVAATPALGLLLPPRMMRVTRHRALSNFAAHPFLLDGVERSSMQGSLQALKFDKPHVEARAEGRSVLETRRTSPAAKSGNNVSRQ